MTSTPRHVALGVTLVVAAAMLWGTTGTVQASSSGLVAPVWIGALRMAVAALFFWTMLAGQAGVRTRAHGLAPGASPVAALLAAGLAMAVYNLAFFAGVRATGVGIGTAICIGSGPLWAGLLQTLIMRRAPG